MLKKVLLNKRFVPVPVPIQNLEQAIVWLESTLVLGDQTITKIVFNNQEITDSISPDILRNTFVKSTDRLEFVVEAPIELAIQVLEAARNIASVLFPSLKAIAVACWQLTPRDSVPPEALELQSDLSLISALIQQYTALGEVIPSNRSVLEGLGYSLNQAHQGLAEASKKQEWKLLAKILLNRIEELLDQLIQETARLESDLLSSRAAPKSQTRAQITSLSR